MSDELSVEEVLRAEREALGPGSGGETRLSALRISGAGYAAPPSRTGSVQEAAVGRGLQE
jgi:hypothetical protein